MCLIKEKKRKNSSADERGTHALISNHKKNLLKSKRSQVTLFIIIALMIVGGIALFFAFKDKLIVQKVPERFQPIYNYFTSCVEENAEIGAQILGERAGYIKVPDFVPGSEFMPSSSQLSFFGQPVPYWYYVSGNNLIKEQIPNKGEMEEQLEDFLEEKVFDCDFSNFEMQGFFIALEEPKANVKINDNNIDVDLNVKMTVSDGEETAQIREIDSKIHSKLGKFYNLAREIYDKEKKEAFLENYGIDVLRLYAPVDGVELDCSPKVWVVDEVVNDVKRALSANVGALKLNGDYYTLKNKENKYFVVDLKTDEQVNFMYSETWPTKIEVEPSDAGILVAEPVGMQPGLGILGFCYVPYHFVYDLSYPVLIQIHDGLELFQFPVVVVIRGNLPREALPVESLSYEEPELCKYKNQEVSVYTYDSNLNPVEADISFKCFTNVCDIGKTEIFGNDAVLQTEFPQCVNGFILASADGYDTKKFKISTNQENIADILLDKLYEQEVILKVGGRETSEQALIYFEGDESEKSKTIVWPQNKKISLSEGAYNVSVYVYTDSTLKIPASSETKCINIPKSGLFGLFGQTEERCFKLEIPEQTLNAGVIGGGRASYYITESELQKGKLEINVERFPTPTSLEQLQDNYNLLEFKPVDLIFK